MPRQEKSIKNFIEKTITTLEPNTIKNIQEVDIKQKASGVT